MNSNDELASFENDETAPSINYSAKKRRTIWLLLAWSAIAGVICCVLPEEEGALDFFIGLPILFLGVSWCFTDAAQRNHRMGRTRFLLVLCFVIGLPIYLVQSRGFGAIKSCGLLTLFVAAMCATSVLTAIITILVADVTGLWEINY